MASNTLQGKYLPLYEYLSKQQDKHIVLTFEEIEEILQAKLPKSAYKYQAWWGNTRSGTYVQAAAWLEAGFRVDIVQFGRCVEFIKVSKEILTKKKNKVMRESLISKSIPMQDTTYCEIESFQKIMAKMDAVQQFFAENHQRRFAEESLVSQFKVFCEWRRLFGKIEQDVNYLAKQLMQEYLLEKHLLEPNSSYIKQQDEYTFLYEEETKTEEKIAAILKTSPPALTADFAPSQRSMFLQDCRLLNRTNATIQYYFVTEEPAFNVIEKNYKQYLGNIKHILLPKVIADKFSLHA
ncbi:DUF7662 domain-containing protein [Rummeliibacillus pycnus]|uniref:DUF7662 domain-containing protein n=1 Tax=Rummeliibacillus pycnus TaxID=101070 RepID=UPI003D28C4E7